jgi:hypothetical protein
MAWPVDDPPKGKLHTNLQLTAVPAPFVFDGPANLLAALQRVAQGAVELSQTKQAYDAIPR